MTSPTSAQQACPSCGTGVQSGDRFCAICGTLLSGMVTASVSPWDLVLRRLQAATLGDFEIKRELGRGGMAAVYLAHDIALDLKVAIKVMSPGIMMGEGMIDRFRMEAVTVAKLSHPNIVRVHALRQVAEDLHFIVMQYVPGHTIDRIVRENGPLPIPVVRAVLGQVARALAYAHKRGVVHRDVKPGNIMLDAAGDAVVTDFGIAKVAANPSHTVTGAIVGTPAYMSPEQCFARPLTGASDQYSLGIVAFEMITGQVPFGGPAFAVMHGHTHGAIPSIRDLQPSCPPDLEAAVSRMLAKAPEDRFPTIADAADAVGLPPLGEHDPIREQLIRLAAVEDAAALDALHPTPVSPIPQTRASMPHVVVSPPPATTVPSAPPPRIPTPAPAPSGPERPAVDSRSERTTAADAAAARTVVDPALLREPKARVDTVRRSTTGRASVFSRRVILWLAGAAAALAAVVLVVASPWTSVDSTGRGRQGTIDTVNTPPPPAPPTPTPGPRTVPTVRIASVPISVAVGDTFTLDARVTGVEPATRTPNEWQSRAPSVLRVDAAGRARALREGTAVVVVSNSSARDSASIRVLPAAARLAGVRLVIAAPIPPVRVADRVRLRISEVDGAGTRRQLSSGVAWSSADPAIASVDARTGELVARAPGRARISAGTPDGRTAIEITVEPAIASVPSPTPVPPVRESVIVRPPTPTPEPARPPPVKSQAELRAELENAVETYARAFEGEDLDRLRALNPAMTAAQVDGFRSFFDTARDIKMTIDRIELPPQLSATTGSEAHVRINYRIEYYNSSLRRAAQQSSRWDATLQRTANGWRILIIR